MTVILCTLERKLYVLQFDLHVFVATCILKVHVLERMLFIQVWFLICLACYLHFNHFQNTEITIKLIIQFELKTVTITINQCMSKIKFLLWMTGKGARAILLLIYI